MRMTRAKTKMSAKPVVLIDGSSYLFRAHHALQNLSNSAGKPTASFTASST